MKIIFPDLASKRCLPSYVFFVLLAFQLNSCSSETSPPPKYLRWVGDIAFDPKTDKKDFHLCDADDIKQYHNFSFGFLYKGEKIALEKEIREQYNTQNITAQSGWLRIRFIVNCQGETDRFRIIGMDENRKPQTFDKSISDQLLNITKRLKGWLILPDDETRGDYYIYLIFKLENGKIKEILP
ncbi:MAG: hypothetical protein IPI60_16140 [Saprospiraceae bacterium]|nr:hypothetical protein [Saprospiraceae bacterium]